MVSILWRTKYMITEQFCKKCNHLCHCIEADHEGCKCTGCNCKVSIHELAKANPDKTYKELEKVSVIKEKVFGGVIVVDSTDDCESCQ